MARVVFAILPQSAAAQSAKQFAQNSEQHRSLRAMAYPGGQIDASTLPESATITGSYTKWIAVLGGVVGALGGAALGAWGIVRGLDSFLGTVLGGVSGTLIGVLCAIMSGNRQPLLRLREAAGRTEDHESLLAVEVEDEREEQLVSRILEAQNPREVGTASA